MKWLVENWAVMLGEGFGFAAAASTRQKLKAHTLRRLGISPDDAFVAVVIEDTADGERSESRQERSAEELCEIMSSISLREMASVADFCEAAADAACGNWGYCHVMTAAAAKERDAAVARERLREIACEVATKHNVGNDSVAFVEAVEAEIAKIGRESESWNHGEVRAEEWAAHRYAGSGAYFDDLNYVNSTLDSRRELLENLLEFLGNECPLLVAAHSEKKLSQTSPA